MSKFRISRQDMYTCYIRLNCRVWASMFFTWKINEKLSNVIITISTLLIYIVKQHMQTFLKKIALHYPVWKRTLFICLLLVENNNESITYANVFWIIRIALCCMKKKHHLSVCCWLKTIMDLVVLILSSIATCFNSKW